MPYKNSNALPNFVIVRKSVNEIFIKEFGEKVREIRLQKNISMQTLAYMINVEYSQISRIEQGKINTSINMVYEISIALQIKPSELFNFDIK